MALPNIGFDIVDVRSVADLLVKAMETQHIVPSKELPNLLVRLLSNFDASIKPILVDLAVKRKVDISKARRDLQCRFPVAKYAREPKR